jgi:zinc transport system substrate-binding protein
MTLLTISNAAGSAQVFVSILPQKYFVEKIGGELVDVSVMVKPGASPATYEPKPHQMVALSLAKIYFAIGIPFEKAWLKKIASANPNMVVVHTERGIEKRAMSAHKQHKAEKAFEHHHEIKDPHICQTSIRFTPKFIDLITKNLPKRLFNWIQKS